jgi:hypothetical protein
MLAAEEDPGAGNAASTLPSVCGAQTALPVLVGGTIGRTAVDMFQLVENYRTHQVGTSDLTRGHYLSNVVDASAQPFTLSCPTP